jgi:hypothetical protein
MFFKIGSYKSALIILNSLIVILYQGKDRKNSDDKMDWHRGEIWLH